MNIQALKSKLSRVIMLLRNSGFDDEANALEQNLLEIQNQTPNAVSAATEIKSRCHVKWLGDLQVQGVELNEWLTLLDEVKSALA